MGTSPVSVLVVIGIYVAFYGVMLADGAAAACGSDCPDISDDPSDTIDTGGFGGVNILGDIINAVIGVVEFIFNALTFNVKGAPAFIRAPVAIAIVGSLVWSVVTLIRGN